jgi:uncharacterized membrane protein
VEEAVLKDHDRTAVRVSTVPQAGVAQGALLGSGTLPRLCTKTQDISLRAECRSTNDEFDVLQKITCSCLACTIFPYFSIFYQRSLSTCIIVIHPISITTSLRIYLVFDRLVYLAFISFPMAFSVHVWFKSTFWMIVTNIMSEHVVYNSKAVCLHATQF